MTRPLAALRVIDLCDGPAGLCATLLADLGAAVVRVESPAGARSRSEEPVLHGVGLPYVLRGRGVTPWSLDLAEEGDRERLLAAAAEVDIVVLDGPAATLLDPDELRRRLPGLVVVALTPYGLTGPHRGRVVTDAVLTAVGGVLSRSGLPGEPPLLPPPGLADGTAAVQAAWAALVAHVHASRTGRGELVDVSAHEAVVHGFDPGFGTQGSAAAGRSEDFPRDRPDARAFYPVFRCADGHVRICLLATRQWRAMFAWLGSPEEFADPRYDTIPGRFAAADRLHPLIAELFAGRKHAELVDEGAERGIPVGGVLAPSEAIEEAHFRITGALRPVAVAPDLEAVAPQGFATVDGVRAAAEVPVATIVDGHPSFPERTAVTREASSPERPLAGLRVLDLGVIVAGAEAGRLWADQGAEVIKVENAGFPDGLRQSRRGAGMSASFAWGQRNKRSIGLDLRTARGRELLRALAAAADVLLANFRPRTLAKLGLGAEDLRAVAPRLVVCDSSAFGASGPWSGRMGYGPLVRAATGLSSLWAVPGRDDAFCDGATVFPDHVAGAVSALCSLAAVIGRDRTGQGAAIEISQADVALTLLGPVLAAESVERGAGATAGRADLTGVFACAGDDEWVVVQARDGRDWDRLRTLVGGDAPGASTPAQRRDPDGPAHRAVASWVATRSPAEAVRELQAAGVPAGAMVRLPEEPDDEHLVARGAFSTMEHPDLPVALPANTGPARFSSLPVPALAPAPRQGEHTREIARELLGLSDAEIEELLGAGVLQEPAQ